MIFRIRFLVTSLTPGMVRKIKQCMCALYMSQVVIEDIDTRN